MLWHRRGWAFSRLAPWLAANSGLRAHHPLGLKQKHLEKEDQSAHNLSFFTCELSPR